MILDARELSYAYPGAGRKALEGIDFGIEQGEVFGFLGPNGSGKTTTQKLLTRILRGYKGSVSVFGRDLREHDDSYYNSIGVCFELPNLYEKLTAEENLGFYSAFFDTPTDDAAAVLERLDLPVGDKRNVGQWSKGMKMRLTLARSLLNRPRLWFLDEPTTGQDPRHAVFMVFIAAYALILAVVARFGVRWVPIDNLDLYLAPTIVMFGTLLLGTLLGFALIEEREQGTWLLLRVLPLSSTIVFAYFIGSASLLSLVVSFAAAMLYGYPVADWPAFVLMLGASALTAPLVMLLLGALAKNKIEGLAVSKIISAAGVLPALIFFAPTSWQIVAVWCPLYWLYLGLLQAYAGDTRQFDVLYWPEYPPFLPAVASIVLALVGMAVLVRMYTRSAR